MPENTEEHMSVQIKMQDIFPIPEGVSPQEAIDQKIAKIVENYSNRGWDLVNVDTQGTGITLNFKR